MNLTETEQIPCRKASARSQPEVASIPQTKWNGTFGQYVETGRIWMWSYQCLTLPGLQKLLPGSRGTACGWFWRSVTICSLPHRAWIRGCDVTRWSHSYVTRGWTLNLLPFCCVGCGWRWCCKRCKKQTHATHGIFGIPANKSLLKLQKTSAIQRSADSWGYVSVMKVVALREQLCQTFGSSCTQPREPWPLGVYLER